LVEKARNGSISYVPGQIESEDILDPVCFAQGLSASEHELHQHYQQDDRSSAIVDGTKKSDRLTSEVKMPEIRGPIGELAFREVAQAAIAFEFGVPVVFIQILLDPVDEDSIGMTAFRYGPRKHIEKMIFVAIGRIAVEQKIESIRDPSYQCCDELDYLDSIMEIIPYIYCDKNESNRAQVADALIGVISEVHRIMDDPHVEKGMQVLADVLFAKIELTGKQARKIYFDARGPISPTIAKNIKNCRKRLRRALSMIDSTD